MSTATDQRRKERIIYIIATDRPFDESEAVEIMGCEPDQIVPTLKRWCAEDPAFDHATDVISAGSRLLRAIHEAETMIKSLRGTEAVPAGMAFAPFSDPGKGRPL